MTGTIAISSNDALSDIEHHFRITAGPGAGKTFWLANHVRHVARNSKRITASSRIAVISYTNVAVREILRRLDTASDWADVSTIHSFLYRHLVRPYLHLLKDSSGRTVAAHHLVDSHNEHYVNRTHLDAWLTSCNKRVLLHSSRSVSFEHLKTRLRTITVRISTDGTPFLAPCKTDPRDKPIADLLTPDRLLQYKQIYWAEGALDHEDVLYFGYRLLREFPVLRQFLSAKFPYLFIDEFQDTLPVQAELVRWLADTGTIVGVIGDPEQAIYGFLDASATHFQTFSLAGHRSYEMRDNRRSTQALVTFFNQVRTDGLRQVCIRKDPGTPPTVFGGSLADSLQHVRSTSQHAPVMFVLARNHKEVLQARLPAVAHSVDPWDAFEDADLHRFRLMYSLASAADLAQRKIYDSAVHSLVQKLSTRGQMRKPFTFNGEVTLVARRSLALSLVEFMVSRHNDFLASTALDVYLAVQQFVPSCLNGLTLPKVLKGKFQAAASITAYSALVQSLKTPDETRLTRTIHQAKGCEAAAVFVALSDNALDHILKPAANDEEQRVTYVALSRAREELFIYCPDIKRLPEFAHLGMPTQVVGTPSTPASPKPRSRKPKPNQASP